jgi:hypothetical protein
MDVVKLACRFNALSSFLGVAQQIKPSSKSHEFRLYVVDGFFIYSGTVQQLPEQARDVGPASFEGRGAGIFWRRMILL